jgi:hypothetical protein
LRPIFVTSCWTIGGIAKQAAKLAGDPNNPVRIKDDAIADELRAEIMSKLAILREAVLTWTHRRRRSAL